MSYLLRIFVLAALSGTLILLLPARNVIANTDDARWTRVNIPAAGRAGNWVLAAGSDIRNLTIAGDGTLYCFANPAATDYTLFKSSDGGYSWSPTGQVKDEIVDIVVSPDDDSVIYYATSSSVCKSTDAGENFTALPSSPGGSGNDNIEITAIDVTTTDDGNLVAVGTRDNDNSEYGGVYIFDESEFFPSWIDTNIGSYDVCEVSFPLESYGDDHIVAVATDEIDTIITAKVGNKWNNTISNAFIEWIVPVSAAFAFPDDYDPYSTGEHNILFAAINSDSNNGDVYRVNLSSVYGSSTTDLDIGHRYNLDNVDVTGLSVRGNTESAVLFAGASDSTDVYFSTDGGDNWKISSESPTGECNTYVVMAPDFNTSGTVYAGTGGSDSAFSYTMDGGVSWSQIGLIDTGISRILDLAPSPNYEQDNTLFMLTWHNKYNLWYSNNGGTDWQRIFGSYLHDVDRIDKVKLSPQYGNNSQVIFLAGKSSGNPAIWKSVDNGANFTRHRTRDPDNNEPFDVKAWAIVDDNTLFIASYNGTNGCIYYTETSGSSYSLKTTVGSQWLKSIALSPDYENDKSILVGNSNGWVFFSDNGGKSFENLPFDTESPPLSGDISVAFDTNFHSNSTVYAASDTADMGIHRFSIDKSTKWQSINETMPENSLIVQLYISDNGILYAANSLADGGMERCLNPGYSLGPGFETVVRGLEDGAKLSGLSLCDNRIWAIDTANNMVITFFDSLAVPVILNTPVDGDGGIGTIVDYNVGDVSLDWEALSGATNYQWQLDYDESLSAEVVSFEGETKASSVRLPELELATTYHWRVRAIEPVRSPWSDKWSFTTSLGTETVAPLLITPEAGANNVALTPIFQWNAIAGADSYELLVSNDASFADPIIARTGEYTLPDTAWHSDMVFNNATTYFWKVRACGSDSYSAWSAVNAFTTESIPPNELSQTGDEFSSKIDTTAPEWVNKLISLGAALVLSILVILIILVVLVLKVLRQ